MNDWLLVGARVARGAAAAERLDMEIRAGKIDRLTTAGTARRGSRRLDLRGYLLLPGLINAHDHLEFGLFPRLGRGPYPNAGRWARAIYRPDCPPLKELLQVPRDIRLLWGGIRNLLSGVTTVCHHNPYYRIFARDFPVRVPRRVGWAHSLEFSPDLVRRFRKTPRARPFVIHLGEATDRAGAREIFELDAAGALDGRTVLVHGVALGPSGLRLAARRGAALIWCPSSNRHILGRTLNDAAFSSGVPIALGTDSPLSGAGSLLDEVRVARKISGIGAVALYDMVTSRPAAIMRLPCGAGTLEPGSCADLVAVPDRGQSPAAALMRLHAPDIRLVMIGGRIKLAGEEMERRLRRAVVERLELLRLDSGSRRHCAYLSAPVRRILEPLAGLKVAPDWRIS